MVGATPDAIETVPEQGRGALEIKVTDVVWEEEPPVFYQAQLQVQLSVLGFSFGTLAALHRGNKLIWADLMRHEEFIKNFLSKAEEFQWRLTNDRPPEVGADGSEDAGKAIAALFPHDTGEVIHLPAEAMDWTTELETLKAERKDMDEAIRLRENLLKEKIKDATYGVLVDGRRWSWKEQTRVDPPRLEERVSQFRVLRLLRGER
jgi:predicted phage-related endonuclease